MVPGVFSGKDQASDTAFEQISRFPRQKERGQQAAASGTDHGYAPENSSK
jgi:hypothetical protein